MMITENVMSVCGKGAFDRLVKRLNGDRDKAYELVEAHAASEELLEAWATEMLHIEEVGAPAFSFSELPGSIHELAKRCLAIAYLDYMSEQRERR